MKSVLNNTIVLCLIITITLIGASSKATNHLKSDPEGAKQTFQSLIKKSGLLNHALNKELEYLSAGQVESNRYQTQEDQIRIYCSRMIKNIEVLSQYLQQPEMQETLGLKKHCEEINNQLAHNEANAKFNYGIYEYTLKQLKFSVAKIRSEFFIQNVQHRINYIYNLVQEPQGEADNQAHQSTQGGDSDKYLMRPAGASSR